MTCRKGLRGREFCLADCVLQGGPKNISEKDGTCCSGENRDAVVSASPRTKILSFTEGNEEFARQIVGEFLRITPPLLQDIKDALKENNPESLKSFCHRMKGNLSYLGEERLLKIVSSIDCNAPSSEKLHSLFTEMNEVLERLAKEWNLPSPSRSSGVIQSD